MSNIRIEWDNESYSILYTNCRNVTSIIGYGDRHTAFEDHAQNFYELAVALNAEVELEEV